MNCCVTVYEIPTLQRALVPCVTVFSSTEERERERERVKEWEEEKQLCTC